MNPYLLQTSGLTVKFGTQYAVKNLNLHVPQGSIYGLLGRNGAGKTTTMKAIMGLLRRVEGEITLFGQTIGGNGKKAGETAKSVYSRIGSIIETPGFYGHLTGRENLNILAKLRGIHRPDAVEYALKEMGLEQETKKTVSHYSMGMNQRLGIAAALLLQPELLILDEPTNGLDPIGIREMRAMLLKLSQEKGTTIVISSHILSEVEQLVDCMGIMRDGELIQEIGMGKLRELNRNFIRIEVSKLPAAVLLLEQEFGISDYQTVDDHTLYLYEVDRDRAQINRRLMESGFEVTELTLCESNLEDYFTRLTGGIGIA